VRGKKNEKILYIVRSDIIKRRTGRVKRGRKDEMKLAWGM